MYIDAAYRSGEHLCRVATTAAEDVTFNQPPIEDYTAAMSYAMIVKSAKALFGKVSKGRLSMWQFLPMEGPWSSSWYYSNHVLTSKKMAALALGSRPVQIKKIVEAGHNYALWLKEMANSILAVEVEEMVRVSSIYHRATLPTARLKKCTVALLFDMADFMMDLATDFVTEQADCQRANRSVKVTYELMKKQFNDLEFTQEQVQLPMSIEARRLCREHRDDKLTHASWPQEAWKCACCWHPRLQRALALFDADSVPNGEHMSLTRGLVSRGVQPAGAGKRKHPTGGEVEVKKDGKVRAPNDVHYNTDQSVYYIKTGGHHDKLKADWDGQRFTNVRLATLMREHHTRKAEEQLKNLLKGKAPAHLKIKIPCMCAGSKLGCLREDCPYWCDWVKDATQDQITSCKMYYAW